MMETTEHWLKPVNKLNDSLVLVAAREGDVDQFERAVDELGACARATLCKHTNRLGKTVLHEAAQNGRVLIVEKCLSQLGMDPDGIKQGDWTPLMLACTKPTNSAVVRLLVKAGADLTLKNKDGWTAFHVACREGDQSALELMIEEKANVGNSTSKNGRTPLHTAAMFGRLDVVSLLLAKCDYPADQGDSCGSTPLMDALRFGHVDVAKILIDEGKANVLALDSLGRSALHLAAEAGQTGAVRFLVEDCDVSVHLLTENTQQSAVHHAAKEGHVECLRLLKDLGADCQCVDSRGRTPLHLASIAQQADSVRFLLTECSVTDSPDLGGNLAASFAKKCPVITAFSDCSKLTTQEGN